MMILHIVLVAVLLCNIHSITVPVVYVQPVQVDWMEWIPNQMNMK
jgi:hypothetical protein